MLITTHFGHATPHGQFGDAAQDQLTNTLLTVSQQETQLRTTFAQLIPDLIALQTAQQNIPTAFVALMQQYNAAQASFMEAARIWLLGRAQTAASDLPDPGAQAIAVPTFEIPSSGFGRFGAATIPASSIRIKYGIVGREVSTALGDYVNDHDYSGYAGLGMGPLAWAVVVLLGMAIVGGTIVAVAALLASSDAAVANQAITAQAQGRIQEVKSDRELYASTRDACMGPMPSQATRLQCVTSALDVLKTAKEGRPNIVKPFSPTTMGVLTVLGVVTVLGVAGATGYAIYKRRNSGDALPRATARSRSRASYDEDDEMPEDY